MVFILLRSIYIRYTFAVFVLSGRRAEPEKPESRETTNQL